METGDRYGRLVVIGCGEDIVGKDGRREPTCICQCDCGNIKVVRKYCLTSGNTVSCGCYRREVSSSRMTKNMTKHGHSRERLYKVWTGMLRRCEHPDEKDARLYKDKGVSVCAEWHDYEKFKSWSMENGYKDDLTIDRIDSSVGYCPENCRWVDRVVQNNNTSRNHMLTYNGKTMTMAEWSKNLNLSYTAIKSRIRRGWSVDQALSTPIKK